MQRLAERATLFLALPGIEENARRFAEIARRHALLTVQALTKGDPTGAAFTALTALENAWLADVVQGVVPQIRRDKARQVGTRRARGSRRPILDAWLDDQLSRDSEASAKKLWKLAMSEPSLEFDGDLLLERDGVGTGLAFRSFERHVTNAKNRSK